MTYALLILWTVTAQTADPCTTVQQPAIVPAQCPAPASTPAGHEHELRAQLAESRRKLAEANEQIAKLKEEASMPDHAVAALLVSDRPDLAPLEIVNQRHTVGAGRGRLRYADTEMYVSPHPGETMTAVVLTVRNPREAPTWEPKEAFIRAQFSRDPPVPVALRSVPERIQPGQTARVALVFDRLDVDLDQSRATLALLRGGKWEMEIALEPSDFRVASANSGDDR